MGRACAPGAGSGSEAADLSQPHRWATQLCLRSSQQPPFTHCRGPHFAAPLVSPRHTEQDSCLHADFSAL
eukprot:3050303-Pyramimonas_sp.AAC.1